MPRHCFTLRLDRQGCQHAAILTAHFLRLPTICGQQKQVLPGQNKLHRIIASRHTHITSHYTSTRRAPSAGKVAALLKKSAPSVSLNFTCQINPMQVCSRPCDNRNGTPQSWPIQAPHCFVPTRQARLWANGNKRSSQSAENMYQKNLISEYYACCKMDNDDKPTTAELEQAKHVTFAGCELFGRCAKSGDLTDHAGGGGGGASDG